MPFGAPELWQSQAIVFAVDRAIRATAARPSVQAAIVPLIGPPMP